MSLQQVFNIARREYIARVRNKAFVFTTLIVPLFLAFYMFVLPMLFSQAGVEKLTIEILDIETGLSGPIQARLSELEEPEIVVQQVHQRSLIEEAERRSFSDAVLRGELDGYLVLEPDPERRIRGAYYARETANPIIISRLAEALRISALEGLLEGSGVDFAEVHKAQAVRLETVTVSDQGEESGGFESAFFSTLGFAMLMYMAVLINGQGMAMAIVEEKSSKLIEVVLGAVTALEFMVGKILGVLLSGLTQLGIWVLCAVVAVFYALPALAIGGEEMGVDLASILNLRIIFYFCIFFALGYLLYSTMFATVAATCSSTEELGQAMFPAMFPFILALFMTFYAVPNPSTLATRILSLIPLFTPLVMLARVNVLMPPLWEVWLGILLLLVGVLISAWLSSKVFRFALLMQGKRPSLVEIIRMIRNS